MSSSSNNPNLVEFNYDVSYIGSWGSGTKQSSSTMTARNDIVLEPHPNTAAIATQDAATILASCQGKKEK
jgi:hypothetical protein